MLYLPEDYDSFCAYAMHFGGKFFCLMPSGGFVYNINDETLDLSNETEEKLLALIMQSAIEGKNLVYEVYKDKAFDPYPDRGVVY